MLVQTNMEYAQFVLRVVSEVLSILDNDYGNCLRILTQLPRHIDAAPVHTDDQNRYLDADMISGVPVPPPPRPVTVVPLPPPPRPSAEESKTLPRVEREV